MSSLAGTGAVVTGAGSGIGRATASLLVEQGSQAVAADINLTAAQKTGARRSGDVIAAEVDVRDEGPCRASWARRLVCPGTGDSPWPQRLIEGAGESRAALVQRQPMARLGTRRR